MLLSSVLALTVVIVLPLRALGIIEQIQVKLGEPVLLKCNISLHHEIFWLRVNIMEKPRLLMVARLKNDGGLTEVLNYNSTRFEGCLVDKFFALKIFTVLNNDLGSYYCGTIVGKNMEFEDGVHIYGDVKDENFLRPKKDEKDLQRQISYSIFAAVLGVGLLIMVLVVFTVHMMPCRKINITEN